MWVYVAHVFLLISIVPYNPEIHECMTRSVFESVCVCVPLSLSACVRVCVCVWCACVCTHACATGYACS